jgi:hypothetical protein
MCVRALDGTEPAVTGCCNGAPRLQWRAFALAGCLCDGRFRLAARYHLWANLTVLNSLRRSRGLNEFSLRPHAVCRHAPCALARGMLRRAYGVQRAPMHYTGSNELAGTRAHTRTDRRCGHYSPRRTRCRADRSPSFTSAVPPAQARLLWLGGEP